ncbi:hypothetical protein N3K66_006699 [Trichothecium roseum]|uniref:Uncharacterized protein n=1 Tax=Trichothecium roseum TaxID=47278 RepID=A0ACC0UW63_9HYPO|nr:hypothetical protein N3K66_006699 [Trichothecium roseum]
MPLSSGAQWGMRISAIVFFSSLVGAYLFFYADESRGGSPVDGPPELPVLESWPHIEVHDPSDQSFWPYRVFKSSSWTPPNISITRNSGDLADGYLFINPKSRSKEHAMKQSAPVIMTYDNELVYAYDESHGTGNFRVQDWKGKPRLSLWQGESTIGHGYGQAILLDEGYMPLRLDLDKSEAAVNWRLGKDVKAPGLVDFHEQKLTERGTIYMTAYNNTPANLSSIGGPERGWVADSLIYEMDVKTSKILWTWSALDHVDLEWSKLPIQSYMGDGTVDRPWDHFHINSIQEVGDNLLISSRHTWSIYLVSKEEGNIVWTLSGSGEGGDFGPLPEEGQFRWSHDARAFNVTPDSMTVSLIDNHNMKDDNGTVPTRGLLLGLTLPPNPAVAPTVLRSIRTNDHDIYSMSQGSYDPELPNGNQLMCYGAMPMVREYGPSLDGSSHNGDLRWQGQFGYYESAQSYRAFKGPWHGTPRGEDPKLVTEVVRGSNQWEDRPTTLVKNHVSWNGATDIESWNVYVGASVAPVPAVLSASTATPLRKKIEWEMAATALKKGFETVFRLEMHPGWCVQLGAVRAGEEIRRSNTVCI